VGFLKQALELTFFPELFEVRTSIGPSANYGAPVPDAPAV
jgi:tryptophan 2,3-dioxygenase